MSPRSVVLERRVAKPEAIGFVLESDLGTEEEGIGFVLARRVEQGTPEAIGFVLESDLGTEEEGIETMRVGGRAAESQRP